MKQVSVGFDLVIMWSETCAWNREKSAKADMGQRFWDRTTQVEMRKQKKNQKHAQSNNSVQASRQVQTSQESMWPHPWPTL